MHSTRALHEPCISACTPYLPAHSILALGKTWSATTIQSSARMPRNFPRHGGDPLPVKFGLQLLKYSSQESLGRTSLSCFDITNKGIISGAVDIGCPATHSRPQPVSVLRCHLTEFKGKQSHEHRPINTCSIIFLNLRNDPPPKCIESTCNRTEGSVS